MRDLDETLREALRQKLLAMADDELLLAHRNAEWTGHAPILEEDIAFANIAQDELGHASLWYGLLEGEEPDRLVYFRPPADFRSAQIVELPNGDWAFSMLRQYLFDAFELLRSDQLLASAFRPLAEVAAKVRQEERYHYRHTSAWITRLGRGTEESHRRTQDALATLWPLVAQLFVPSPGEERLYAANIVPDVAQLRQMWRGVVEPFLISAGLELPAALPSYGPSREVHTEYLAPLLDELQEVARLDPEAAW